MIIPCHAAARTIAPLLDCLERQSLPQDRFEVLLMDAGADGTRRVIEERLARWSGASARVVTCPLSGGPAVKRNLGARQARGRLLAFTDSDCLPDPDWLAGAWRAYEDGYKVIQGHVLLRDGDRPSRLAHWIVVDNDHGLYETANIFYDRELFLSLGGFPEHWFRRYLYPFAEDADLGWRAVRAGAPYRMEGGSVVRHPVGAPNLRNHLREQWQARGFPEMVREMPELRGVLLQNRVFLSPDTRRFTLAIAGLAASRRFPAAALLAVPYLNALAAEGRGLGPRRHSRGMAAKLLSDGVTSAGLWLGSARFRSLVL